MNKLPLLVQTPVPTRRWETPGRGGGGREQTPQGHPRRELRGAGCVLLSGGTGGFKKGQILHSWPQSLHSPRSVPWRFAHCSFASGKKKKSQKAQRDAELGVIRLGRSRARMPSSEQVTRTSCRTRAGCGPGGAGGVPLPSGSL